MTTSHQLKLVVEREYTMGTLQSQTLVIDDGVTEERLPLTTWPHAAIQIGELVRLVRRNLEVEREAADWENEGGR